MLAMILFKYSQNVNVSLTTTNRETHRLIKLHKLNHHMFQVRTHTTSVHRITFNSLTVCAVWYKKKLCTEAPGNSINTFEA